MSKGNDDVPAGKGQVFDGVEQEVRENDYHLTVNDTTAVVVAFLDSIGEDGGVVVETSVSDQEGKWNFYFTDPLESGVQEYELYLKSMEMVYSLAESYVKEGEKAISTFESKNRVSRALHRLFLSTSSYRYDLAEPTIELYRELLEEAGKSKDTVETRLESLKSEGYVVEEREDGEHYAVHPYPRALTVRVEEGASLVSVVVHEQADEEQDKRAYEMALALSDLIQEEGMSSADVNIQRGSPESWYSVLLEKTTTD